MKHIIASVKALCLLLAQISYTFGDEEAIRVQKDEMKTDNLRPADKTSNSSMKLTKREQNDMWRIILNQQSSFDPSDPRPTQRPTLQPTSRFTYIPTQNPTSNPTTLPPVIPQSPELCEMEVRK